MNWILVFIGSGIGGCLRFGFSELFKNRYSGLAFPLATFLSNLFASIILGVLIVLFHQKIIDEKARLLLAVGLCGGFSTFSTFSAESFLMIEKGQFGAAFFYAVSSVAACILAVAVASKFS